MESLENNESKVSVLDKLNRLQEKIEGDVLLKYHAEMSVFNESLMEKFGEKFLHSVPEWNVFVGGSVESADAHVLPEGSTEEDVKELVSMIESFVDEFNNGLGID